MSRTCIRGGGEFVYSAVTNLVALAIPTLSDIIAVDWFMILIRISFDNGVEVVVPNWANNLFNTAIFSSSLGQACTSPHGLVFPPDMLVHSVYYLGCPFSSTDRGIWWCTPYPFTAIMDEYFHPISFTGQCRRWCTLYSFSDFRLVIQIHAYGGALFMTARVLSVYVSFR